MDNGRGPPRRRTRITRNGQSSNMQPRSRSRPGSNTTNRIPSAAIPQQDVPALNVNVENLLDPHRGLRLDIDGMSYEDLLALGERIGKVNTGASEEIITSQLKTKLYTPNFLSIDLNELPPEDQETDSCIICQEEFKYRENIGTIQCGHEFHADCIFKWLMLKNECPVCKSEALTLTKKY